jgi:E3 ubiquitin-protein ligase RFWD2
VPLQGAELPMKELDSLLHLLGERKRKLEQEEAESNMDVLLDFLHLSRQRKQEELQEVRH